MHSFPENFSRTDFGIPLLSSLNVELRSLVSITRSPSSSPSYEVVLPSPAHAHPSPPHQDVSRHYIPSLSRVRSAFIHPSSQPHTRTQVILHQARYSHIWAQRRPTGSVVSFQVGTPPTSSLPHGAFKSLTWVLILYSGRSTVANAACIS